MCQYIIGIGYKHVGCLKEATSKRNPPVIFPKKTLRKYFHVKNKELFDVLLIFVS
jgi:hypothetical protein